MKLPIVCALLTVASVSAAEDKPDGPMIRVSVQLIEVPVGTATGLMDRHGGDGAKLRESVEAAVREGTARIIDAASVTTLPNERAEIHSGTEGRFPVEMTLDSIPHSVGAYVPRNPALRTELEKEWFDQLARPWPPWNWNTRIVGLSLVGWVDFDAATGGVAVSLDPQWWGELEPELWKKHVDEWGDASVKRPVFTTVNCQSSLTLEPGRFVLAAVLSPQPQAPPPALVMRVMVFARADLLR